jgi:hypothetical protein
VFFWLFNDEPFRGHYSCNATCSMGRSSQGGVLSGGAGHNDKHIKRNGRHCTSSVAQVAPPMLYVLFVYVIVISLVYFIYFIVDMSVNTLARLE